MATPYRILCQSAVLGNVRALACVAVLIACQWTLANQVAGQDISRLAYSNWSTRYQTPSGDWVTAAVYLRGHEGYYLPNINRPGARGLLCDITYHPRFDHEKIINLQRPKPPTPAITGTFNLFGATGFFVFREPDRNGKMDGYSGSWQFKNGQLVQVFGGSWDGELIAKLTNPNQPLAAHPPVAKPVITLHTTPVTPKPDPVFGQTNETNTLVDALSKMKATQPPGLTKKEEDVVAPNGWVKLDLKSGDDLEGGNDAPIDDVYFTRLMTSRNYVCKLKAADDIAHPVLEPIRKDQVFGTGFLVGDSLVLTSNHVVPTNDVAKSAMVAFEGGADNQFAISEIVHRSDYKEQDFSLLRVKPNAALNKPGALYGHYHLNTSDEKRKSLYPRSFLVNIIHYPGGQEHRAYEIRGRRLLFKGDELDPKKRTFVAYDAGTEEGSSGAPVFNDFWWLVALHKGKQQADDDPLVNVENYRKGIRIDVIIDSIRSHCDPNVLQELKLPPAMR